jgi:hypothetical protein
MMNGNHDQPDRAIFPRRPKKSEKKNPKVISAFFPSPRPAPLRETPLSLIPAFSAKAGPAAPHLGEGGPKAGFDQFRVISTKKYVYYPLSTSQCSCHMLQVHSTLCWIPRCFRWNRNAARVVWILASTPPVAMCGRGGCDVRVLQVQQKSQIVAPLLHPKSLIINVCSTVAGFLDLSINLAFLMGAHFLMNKSITETARNPINSVNHFTMNHLHNNLGQAESRPVKPSQTSLTSNPAVAANGKICQMRPDGF